ncbi:MAG: deoxyribodipyrimidine photo-lyase [Litoreibacter sp.]|uniref:cryptochrome/photolyase family protein n=1 Tax=Litoreibacter sp. TaxID=1969459 RepID=UPI003299C519
MTQTPILFWLRRDLRLADHEGLTAAAATGRPVIPVFIHDEVVETHGAAPKWRLGLGVEHFAKTLEGIGSRLILRRGPALKVLRDLVVETGAGAVWWSRAYDPAAIERDKGVKAGLQGDGVEAQSFKGHVLFEPWIVETKTGGFYKVFTPMWKTVRSRELPRDLAAVDHLQPPERWPASDEISQWNMGADMRGGAQIVAQHVVVGEAAARARLQSFVGDNIADYLSARDQMATRGTSMLSENLTYGEISPRTCWHAGWQALHESKAGAEVFLKELVWREFAYHLAYHTPRIIDQNWREEWDAFGWKTDETSTQVAAWTRGRTGVQLVDAAMREMYVTGYMHNRGRMIVASYLTKHLMTHWKVGQAWFADCLIDWDPASNAMGWQWSAGCGPDATPYFRVFNADTQAEKFDPDRRYRARYLAEPYTDHGQQADDYFSAIPKAWNLSPDDEYPAPVVSLAQGRQIALDAYKARG